MTYSVSKFSLQNRTPDKTPRRCVYLRFSASEPKTTSPVNAIFTGLCFVSQCFPAEREGFEPPEQLPVHRISSAARSTTLAPFQLRDGKDRNKIKTEHTVA